MSSVASTPSPGAPQRALVTGGSGFVGARLQRLLHLEGDEVVAPPPEVDITDATQIRDAFHEARPDVVYHLAGQANVGTSWTDTARTYAVNFDGTRNVLDAARSLDPAPRVLVVSSADVYGPFACNTHDMVDEDVPARPVSPYGASKLAAEVVARQAYDGFGTHVVITRAFNHIGPGQSDGFVVSAIAKQIALSERDGSDELLLGNLDAARDFLDVDDVVRAYRLAIRLGRAGETYNVASGVAVPIRAVLDHLLGQTTRALRVVTDPSLQRPVDVPRMVGDASRLRRDTGWEPQSSWQHAADAALDHWRGVVANVAAPD